MRADGQSCSFSKEKKGYHDMIAEYAPSDEDGIGWLTFGEISAA
jgi:hypothetical protein